MSIKYDQIIEILKNDVSVFRNISLESLLNSLQVFRIFELREGEAVNLSGTETDDYLFVLLGKVEVHNAYHLNKIATPSDTSDSPILLPQLPGLTRIIAIEDSYVVHVDNVLFEHLQIYEHSVAQIAADWEIPVEYLNIARNSDAFQKLPVESAEQALRAFRVVNVAKGEEIISFDEAGDTFYVLISGRAEMSRQDPDTGDPTLAGELKPGDRFGEDALLVGQEGLEGVKALEDCTLLALSKKDFDNLLAKPLVPSVTAAVAHAMLAEENCQAIDVRYDVEYEMQHIPGAALMMFHEMRDQIDQLDKSKRYIVYCTGGKMGTAATFTLTRLGFDAMNLEGGMHAWTFEKAEGLPGEEQVLGQEEEIPTVPVDNKEIESAAKEPTVANTEPGDSFHSFVCSYDMVRVVYPNLVMAINARRMGRRAAVFFTNSGVSVLVKDRAASLTCQMGAAKFAAMMNKFVARTLKAEYRERGMFPLNELIKMAQREGVEFYACKMSLETLEESQDDLLEGVEVIQPEQFLTI